MDVIAFVLENYFVQFTVQYHKYFIHSVKCVINTIKFMTKYSKLSEQLNNGCSHPNIFNLRKLLKQIQAANEVTMIQYAAGGVRVTKRRKYRSIDERILQLKERLQRGDIDIIQYADAASHDLYLD
ncbi:hypothetical protein KUTeg_010889 [Tegillarca granosa]|uniref:Uncharacterized protein n=1 Tax=Tegillarca granosa TaxID=220873 RepID=A0ABQ9F2I0_TEGGR|nr:hypothetical protein KUTeg_010889 [Tegillarca granosa]